MKSHSNLDQLKLTCQTSNLDQLRLTCQTRNLNHEPRLGLTTFLKLYFYLIMW